MQPRDLAWDGCLNVRELGGLPLRDGGETRFGAVVRADSVRRLSEEGWQALVDHGVRTVVDLRGHDERAKDPPAEVPVEVAAVPFFACTDAEWNAIQAELAAARRNAPDLATGKRDSYVLFLERFRANVAAAVRAIAAAPDGAVLVHCAGGKDRTGLVAALLLHLAGVDDGEIAADYALSEERLRPRHERWFAAAETEAELEELHRMAQTPAATMLGVLRELEERYGGVEPYLLAAGVTAEELERVRARLRG